MVTTQRPDSRHFLLVGNGSYQNRGCEAIVRGTMEILRREYGPQVRALVGVYARPETILTQNTSEIDPAVSSFSIYGRGPRFSRKWWAAQADNRLGTSFSPHVWDLHQPARGASVALEVGGDNYSMDFSKPLSFMAMDRYLRRCGIPVVLWGASVGPFDAAPLFARKMFEHLRNLSGIFVRESESLEYLQTNGVSDNVSLVGDPAFLMPPVEPPASTLGFTLPEDAIGINISPLMAYYHTGRTKPMSLRDWGSTCIGFIKSVATLKRAILLIPHVSSNYPGNDDFGFLKSLWQDVAANLPVPILMVPPGLGAAELKWVIARCSVFAGSRTHATIAALSSYVPTLSIAYSRKARGINRDIFGSLEHCIPVTELTAGRLTERLACLLSEATGIRSHLATRIPEVRVRALGAGSMLRRFIERA